MRTTDAFARAAVTAAVGMLLLGGQPASGSVQQPAVVSEQAAAQTPHVEATADVPHPLALAVGQVGGTMYVGGKFTSAQNAEQTESFPRTNLMAFDAATGTIDSDFQPDLNKPVFAVLGVGDAVYVGGQFTSVDGVTRPGLAKLRASSGELIRAFKPALPAGGRVSEVRLVNGRLLVGGTFAGALVALDPITGINTGYLGVEITGKLRLTTNRTEVEKFAVNPQGTRLVAVGNFTAVNGVNRKRAFMLNLGDTGATLANWYYAPLDHRCESAKPTYQAYLQDVDFSPDGTYFVVVATGFVPAHPEDIGTAICDAAARFETDISAPATPTWINYTGGDTLHAVAATGAAVYVQGHNRWLDNPQGRDFAGPGAVSRRGIGAIDPVSGAALAWDPDKPAVQGGHDFLATPEGLWVVSDSLRTSGDYHRGIAFLPLS